MRRPDDVHGVDGAGKDLTIKILHRMKHTYPRMFQLVTSGGADARSMVTHRFPLREVGRAFETARKREGIKMLVEC